MHRIYTQDGQASIRTLSYIDKNINILNRRGIYIQAFKIKNRNDLPNSLRQRATSLPILESPEGNQYTGLNQIVGYLAKLMTDKTGPQKNEGFEDYTNEYSGSVLKGAVKIKDGKRVPVAEQEDSPEESFNNALERTLAQQRTPKPKTSNPRVEEPAKSMAEMPEEMHAPPMRQPTVSGTQLQDAGYDVIESEMMRALMEKGRDD